MRGNDEEDWLDEAFDERKDADSESGRMGGGSKAAVGIGCVAAAVLMVVAFAMGLGFLDALSQALS